MHTSERPPVVALWSGLLLLVCLLPVGCGEQEPVVQVPLPQIEAPAAPEAAKALDFQAELPQAPRASAGEALSPPSREEIPEGPFGDAVRRGRDLFIDTPAHAGDYVGNALSCASCHLDEGRRPNSAPMWGAWGRYPQYRKKNDKVNTMEERLMGCFTYSLNAQASKKGKAPPFGDEIYADLQTYMFWLATGAPVGATLPGSGYPAVKLPEGGYDVLRGEAVFAETCAVCHGLDGQGQKAEGKPVFPALWGDASFNWGAGMHRINTAASFIQANMPLGQPGTLTDAQAWDVAAYMNSHARPADPRAKGSTIAATDKQFHSHECSYGDVD